MGVEPKLHLKKFDGGKYVFVVSIYKKKTLIATRLNFKWSCLNTRQSFSGSNKFATARIII